MPRVSGAVPGHITAHSYSVVHPIAAGGMGRVDLVARREGRFFRLFAQKRLRADLVDDADVRRMFLDEARIAGLVRHPNVVSVVDVGEDTAGPFLVMDFVEGVPLSLLMERAAASGERLPLEVCFRIAIQVADGLHAVHELRGPDREFLHLVHRDISPQNILLGFDGIARVTDFGIARALGRASKTATGVLKGKLGYMAPEQLRFEEPDRRADLFAFGVVLFEMLSGDRLYKSVHDMDGPRRILNEPPPDLADHRDDAEPEHVELLFELLAKDRAHRPSDARAVARRIEGMLASVLANRECTDTAAYLERLFSAERETMQRQIAAIDASLHSVAGQVDGSAATAVPAAGRSRGARLARRAALVVAVAVAVVSGARAAWRPAPAVSGPPASSAPSIPAPPPAPPVIAAAPSITPPAPRQPAGPLARRKTARRVVSPVTPADGCKPPYTIDARGTKQFKVHCLVDVRR
jgi:eukaryotic-like serine/threonine-protein kinase